MLLELLQYFLIKQYYKNYVCNGYIENINERTLFTYSFVIDTIKIQDDLYKRRIFYVLYVYRTLYEEIKLKSISHSHCHTCDNIYIGESGFYELFPLL